MHDLDLLETGILKEDESAAGTHTGFAKDDDLTG